jgi:hypothetical protein
MLLNDPNGSVMIFDGNRLGATDTALILWMYVSTGAWAASFRLGRIPPCASMRGPVGAGLRKAASKPGNLTAQAPKVLILRFCRRLNPSTPARTTRAVRIDVRVSKRAPWAVWPQAVI